MKAGEVRRGLRKLTDLKPRGTGHAVYRIKCDRCDTQVGWTKLSRKPDGTQLGKRLEGLIPDQLNTTAKVFVALCDCTKGKPDYLASVGHAH